MEPKAYTEIVKSILEAIALSEATLHEDIQTDARAAEVRKKYRSAKDGDEQADIEELGDDERDAITRLYGKGGKVIGKQFKPVFVKGLDKIGQEIWSIGPKYYVVAWTHDIYKERTKETTRSTEVWVSNKTGKVNYGGDPVFELGGWNSGKAIMAALVKSEK